MKAIAVAVITLVGFVSQYAPGVMERVIYNRTNGKATPITPVEGAYAIAVENCAMLSYTGYIFLTLPDGTEVGPLDVYVADCSGDPETTRWMRENNIIAEVEFRVAQQFGFVGRGVRGRLFLFPPSSYFPPSSPGLRKIEPQ